MGSLLALILWLSALALATPSDRLVEIDDAFTGQLDEVDLRLIRMINAMKNNVKSHIGKLDAMDLVEKSGLEERGTEELFEDVKNLDKMFSVGSNIIATISVKARQLQEKRKQFEKWADELTLLKDCPDLETDEIEFADELAKYIISQNEDIDESLDGTETLGDTFRIRVFTCANSIKGVLKPLFFEIVGDLERLSNELSTTFRSLQEKRDLGWSIAVDDLVQAQSILKQYDVDYEVYCSLYEALSTLHNIAPLIVAFTGTKIENEALEHRGTLIQIIADSRKERGLEEDYSVLNLKSSNFCPTRYRENYFYYRYLNSETTRDSSDYELLNDHFKDAVKSVPIRFESCVLALPLLGMYFKSYSLNFQPEYYELNTPAYVFDLAKFYLDETYREKTFQSQDSIVLNMRGIKKLREVIFSAFKEAINENLRSVAISNFEHPSFQPNMPQLAHILREASVMFAGKRIDSIYILHPQLFQLLMDD